jgi:hypothetical protein
VSAVWAYVLLNRTPTWFPLLRSVLLVVGLGVALVIAISPELRGRVGAALAIAAVTLGLAAPAAYTLSTVAQPHSGALPTAGPASAAGGPGGLGGLGGRGGNRGFPGGAFGGGPNGAFANPGLANPGFGRPAFGGAGRGAGGGGAGGLLNGSNPSAAITALFEKSSGFRWTAAAIGANNAAGYQLASGKAIMAIGGFNGTDPTPTLAQFEQYVRAGDIHYFIASGGGGGGGGPAGAGSATSSAISQWVQQNFTAQTVGGTTIYDLSSAASG